MPTVYTIGHSTFALDRFIKLLHAHGIEILADVRTLPGSTRNPQFNQAVLKRALKKEHIQYRWFKDLGGLRSTRDLSEINSAWRVKAFHAYADYMQTPQFRSALSKLETLARKRPVAYMCAEGQWTRCHRRLISDALVVRGWDVRHITSAVRAQPHQLTEFAHVERKLVTYPPTPRVRC
jgi:uncharacterized protein (DUF488 family)